MTYKIEGFATEIYDVLRCQYPPNHSWFINDRTTAIIDCDRLIKDFTNNNLCFIFFNPYIKVQLFVRADQYTKVSKYGS